MNRICVRIDGMPADDNNISIPIADTRATPDESISVVPNIIRTTKNNAPYNLAGMSCKAAKPLRLFETIFEESLLLPGHHCR